MSAGAKQVGHIPCRMWPIVRVLGVPNQNFIGDAAINLPAMSYAVPHLNGPQPNGRVPADVALLAHRNAAEPDRWAAAIKPYVN